MPISRPMIMNTPESKLEEAFDNSLEISVISTLTKKKNSNKSYFS